MSSESQTRFPGAPARSRPTIRIITRVRARPDATNTMRDLLIAVVDPSRAEPACLRYELLQDRETPFEFLLVQEWTSDRAYDEHLETPHMLDAYGRIDPLLDGMPRIQRCSLVK